MLDGRGNIAKQAVWQGRTLHLVQTPAPRIQAVVRKQTAPPDLQVQVLQPPALALTVMPVHLLHLPRLIAPHTQAVGIKPTAPPDLQVQVLQPPALAKPVMAGHMLNLPRMIAPRTQSVGIPLS